jgi:hypothetical protein
MPHGTMAGEPPKVGIDRSPEVERQVNEVEAINRANHERIEKLRLDAMQQSSPQNVDQQFGFPNHQQFGNPSPQPFGNQPNQPQPFNPNPF